jgi:hypothetical protein
MNANDPISQRLFPALGGGVALAMGQLLKAIDDVRPLPLKRRKSLPYDIRDLWASLTADRENRKGSYLSAPDSLSAYLRYFLPWNVYRYLRLLPALDLGFLKAGSVIVDLGSGPLSVAIALFIAKSELRSLPLTVYAVDRAPQGMEIGAEILTALSLALDGKLPVWRIIRIHGDAEAAIKEKADLVTAGYFLNEFGRRDVAGLFERASRAARIMEERLKPEGRILVLEAGDARAASLVSALRESFIESGFLPLAPCPHSEPCPMPGFFRAHKSSGPSGAQAEGHELIRDSSGRPLILASGKRPWCHFSFDTRDAPKELLAISEKAGLPKESASLSFFYARRETAAVPAAAPKNAEPVRIVSEPFPLPENLAGRYACSASGYVLVRSGTASPLWRRLIPGDLLSLDLAASPGRDSKTRALLADLEAPQTGGSLRENRKPEGPRRMEKTKEKRGKHRHT